MTLPFHRESEARPTGMPNTCNHTARPRQPHPKHRTPQRHNTHPSLASMEAFESLDQVVQPLQHSAVILVKATQVVVIELTTMLLEELTEISVISSQLLWIQRIYLPSFTNSSSGTSTHFIL